MPFTGYRITSPFGYRIHPITKLRAFHTGIDLVKSHRAPIHAFVGGLVLHARMGATGSGFGGYGNVVAIQDSKGSLHVYAHLDSCAVRIGQNVKAGQVIGYQGNTGNSTGSHLHYEVRKKSEPKAPYGWIADRVNNCYEPTKYLRDFNKTTVTTSKNYLSKGDTGPKVTTIQQGLIKLGYDLGKYGADGKFGNDTDAALKKFQTAHKLTVDGKFGVKSEAKLNELLKPSVNNTSLPDGVIKQGTKGENVRKIQKALASVYFYPDKGAKNNGVDGIYGPKTTDAVKRFQSMHGLKPDGIYGPQTKKKIEEVMKK